MTTSQNKSTSKGGKYAAKPKNSTSYVPTTSVTTNGSGSTGVVNVSRRRPKKKKWYQKLGFKDLYNKINKKEVSWYWDIRKWSPVIIIIMIIMYVIGFNNGEVESIVQLEVVPTENVYATDGIIETTAPDETELILDDEAVALAILADTSAVGKSDTVKEILMWVAINRVEDRSNGYGGNLIEEINKPKQWQGYDPEGMYLKTTYDIAVRVLNTWRNNGPRPIYNDMLWSVYNADGSITVRNRYNDTKGRNEQTFE